MQSSLQIDQKAQEISFAVLRVAAYMRRIELKKRLELMSYQLIENIAYQDYQMALSTLTAMKGFIILGSNLLDIEPVNTKILIKEFKSISQEIQNFAGLTGSVDISDMFSENDNTAIAVLSDNSAKVVKSGKALLPIHNIIKEKEIELTEIRQIKIIEKIGQSPEGKVQLRDLIAAFPGISERTIRYDLKKLAEEGKIERQGSGGPSNYYVLKPTVLPSLPAGQAGVINL